MTQGTEAGEPGDRYVAMLAEVSRSGRRLSRAETESLRALGERLAETGLGLRELVAHCMGAGRRAWPTLPGIAGATTLAELRQAGEAVLAAAETALAASATATNAPSGWPCVRRRPPGANSSTTCCTAAATPAPSRSAPNASACAWPAPTPSRSPPAPSPTATPARGAAGGTGTDRPLRRTRRPARHQGRAAGVRRPGQRTGRPRRVRPTRPAPRDRLPPARRVATGRRHPGAGGVVRSYEEALDALDFAERLDLPADLLRAEELLVFPVLMRDRAAMADLVRTVLGPLAGARGGAGPLLDTIAVQAEAGYVNAEAARRLGISVRTLGYRTERIKALTGYDLADALHRYTLETAAMGARLLGWPQQPI
ncbi:hypothetical protein KCH_05890 [Kitasatospora cheerisanensis KCTC 2395]|uniref:PucR C-terminal helix-turn-helix domain-containing protein n=1 Tax=Kitasatospora cheerisanensis KCTC 2395 TaxID=1348663 RepID=A0A066Z1P2_9ACTN|nr:hypothetical protein KCH_05890 [Kitasatospora cheerisanensis KCTC 2395]